MIIIAQIFVVLVALVWVAVLFLWVRAKQRDRQRARRGYWIQYVPPRPAAPGALKSSGTCAVVYHENDDLKDFRGKVLNGATIATIYLPDEEQWRREMPAWLRERRALVCERLEAEGLPIKFVDGPPPPDPPNV